MAQFRRSRGSSREKLLVRLMEQKKLTAKERALLRRLLEENKR